MSKKVLLLVLLCFFISIGVSPPAGTVDTVEDSFPLSNDPEERTTVVLREKSILIRALPKAEKFNYVILKLAGGDKTLTLKKCKNARKEDYDVSFSLRGVPDGSYYIEIYSAPEKHKAYVSYIRGQTLHIQVQNSCAVFAQPAALEKNRDVFESSATDAETLEYYTRPSEKVCSGDSAVMERAAEITSGLSADYEKARAIHDWVSANVWYDYDELMRGIPSDNTASDTLTCRKGVCVDYAALTASLLRASNIPARLVTGYVPPISPREERKVEAPAADTVNHVWNEAYIDGRWVIIDASYDSSNSYKNKAFSTRTGMKSRKYFDITIELLSADRYIIANELDPLRFW